MDRILENLLLANIKGSYMILKIKTILAYLEKKILVPLSLKTTRNNGPIKQIFPQILLFMHN
jgi:hypothetical protein